MLRLKRFVKKLPAVPYLYRVACESYVKYRLKSRKTEEVFVDIYKRNAWGGADSVSGNGSDAYQTRLVVRELPSLLRQFQISTMLDIPCGDYHWMKFVDLDGIVYTGADIVSELVEKNNVRHANSRVNFQKLDLVKDKLPAVDLVFCRDCLVHLCYEDLFSGLKNICYSQAKYLLTTTFPARACNRDILTGQWRPLNFEVSPFMFPKPLAIIVEGCTEGSGAYGDKSLGLWSVDEIRKCLKSN